MRACHHDEHGEHDQPGDDQRPHRDRADDRAPVERLPLLDAEHQQEHADRGQRDADQVEPARRPSAGPAPAARPRRSRSRRPARSRRRSTPSRARRPARRRAAGRPASRHRRRSPTGSSPGPRLAAGNVRVITAIVCGVIIAAPSPCTTRAAISMPTLEVSPHHSDASVNTVRPDQVDPLRAEPVAEPTGDQQRHGVGQQVGAGHPQDRVDVRAATTSAARASPPRRSWRRPGS